MAFGGFLQANTAVDVMVGPFLDESDGKTAETGLTVTQSEVRLSKNGANIAQKNEATSLTHDELGNYVCKLDTTDTNTEGILTIMVHESGALPVKMDYMVLAQAAYISLVTAKDTGYIDTHVKTVEAGIIANASFNADVGSTAHGTNIIALAVRKILEELNLDHLMKVATSDRANLPEVVDDTVLANIMTKTDGDTSDFNQTTDSLEAIRDKQTDIETDTAEIGTAGAGLSDLGGMSTAMKAEVQTECDDALVANNLDHLCKVATAAADMTTEVVDNSILSRMLASGDTSAFDPTTDSLQDIRDKMIKGPGDYEVTVTIRTTGGAAVAGVAVWLNTSNSRASAVAGTLVTDDAGQVKFNLNYTTYYIFCHLAGYTFLSANMTPAAGSVSFTKDIAAAVPATGASSDYEESFLTRAIDRTREQIDEPTVKAKYEDADIIKQLEFSYILVLGEKNRNALTPAVGRITITMAADTFEYVLPYTVGAIEAIYEGITGGGRIFYAGRGQFNPLGRKLWVEGNVIHFQDTGFLSLGTELTVEYTPAGIARLHNGTCTINSDGNKVTLGSTPNVGILDTHVDAYIGSVLRILKVSGTTVTGNMLQERTITEYNNVTRVATISPALNPVPTTDDGSIFYEIAPAIHKGLDMVVALHAAKTIARIEGLSRAGNIEKAYQEAVRHVRLSAYYSNIQDATTLHSDNFDNRRY